MLTKSVQFFMESKNVKKADTVLFKFTCEAKTHTSAANPSGAKKKFRVQTMTRLSLTISNTGYLINAF